MTTQTNKKLTKAEQHQMELAGELGRAAAITRHIIGDKETLAPFTLADMLTSIPEDEDAKEEKEFIDEIKAALPKARELAVKIFGEATIEGAVALALRTPEGEDEEELDVFVEDFTFAVEAIKAECGGAVAVSAACMFYDELNQ